MEFPRAWLLAAGWAVSIFLAAACAAPEVLPPPATATPASEYLEKPQPVLVQGALVPQPANVATEVPISTPLPQLPEEQSTPVPPPPSLCATVTAATLNVRSRPEVSDATLVGQVQQGEVFAIIGNNSDGSWFQVEIPRIAGATWLYSDFVDEGPCP